MNLFASCQGGLILGQGAIEGKIVDELQQPLQAEVMVIAIRELCGRMKADILCWIQSLPGAGPCWWDI